MKTSPLRSARIAVLSGVLLLLGALAGCATSPSPPERPDPSQMVDGGSWYSREQWPHDGKPYESQHFAVYSDGASQEAKRRLAELAEQVLAELVDEMGLEPATMFRFPPGQDKVDLYANRYNLPDWGGGARAYYAGLIIWSFDHEAEPRPTDVGTVRLALKHELVHVVEALLKGRFVGDIPPGDPRRMPVWFSEGTAEAVTGGSTGGVVRSLDAMNNLIDAYGRINPIGWRVDLSGADYDPDVYYFYYYPMAQLAIDYLLDPDGLGKSPKDIAAAMLDMGDGSSFAAAFEDHMGISEANYEAEFFTRMDGYLPQSEASSSLPAIGPGPLSLLAATLLAGSLVWGWRRWVEEAPVAAPPVEPSWSRRARRGFIAEISFTALIVGGFVALLLFSIAFAELPRNTNRAPGYLVTAAYLLASAGISLWSIRRWAARSRDAYLVLLVVVIATAVTAVTIELIF